MAYVALILVAALFGTYGYWRGAARFGLALVPLLTASLVVWLLGPLVYRIDALRNIGLIWPGCVLSTLGLGGGLGLRFWLRRKLPKKPSRGDRIGGAAIGLFISLLVVWLGCVYVVVQSASRQPGQSGSSTAWMAGTLNSTVVRWIPGIGAGSDAMMNMVEIATADEAARFQAIEDLGLRRLADLPQMKAIANDATTQADVEAAGKGSIAAIWRLQRNSLIIELLEADEVGDVFSAQTLRDLAEAVRKAR